MTRSRGRRDAFLMESGTLAETVQLAATDLRGADELDPLCAAR